MRQVFVVLVIALASLLGASAQAAAQERFALVIGNADYRSVEALPNPARDAQAMEKLLRAARFNVTLAPNLTQSEMRRTVRDFAEMLSEKGEDTVALVYFAGHGLQIDGQNYLLPVDAEIGRESDVALEAVRLADLLNILESAPSRTKIAILDACRNNPFKDIGEAPRGLAIVNAPAGSVIAYSTSPGTVAEDGVGVNSPFTKALVEAARAPGAPIESVFQQVRLAVHTETDGRQTPWEVTALTESFQFFPGDGKTIRPEPEKSETAWRRELRSIGPKRAYEQVVVQNNVTVYQIFVTLYADTSWGTRIRAILERRLEMLAWFDAVTLNTQAAFEAFLRRYPKSDLAATAKRLAERAKTRSLQLARVPSLLKLKPVPPRPEVRTVVRKVPVEVVTYKDKIVYKDRIIPKTVYKDRIVPKTVYKDRIVPKIVYKDRIVPKTVYKDKIVYKTIYRDRVIRKIVVKPRICRKCAAVPSRPQRPHLQDRSRQQLIIQQLKKQQLRIQRRIQ